MQGSYCFVEESTSRAARRARAVAYAKATAQTGAQVLYLHDEEDACEEATLCMNLMGVYNICTSHVRRLGALGAAMEGTIIVGDMETMHATIMFKCIIPLRRTICGVL